MADLEAFRRDTRAWLEANAPASLRGLGNDPLHGVWGGRKWKFENDDQRVWLERAAERGWTAPGWPKEYGGGGLSAEEAKVLAQELARLRLPQPLIGFGLTMIGPTLLRFGNEEQKREHLPKICRGEIRWCQGYSEPGAGSDLASLQTRAVPDGDDFVVNGRRSGPPTPTRPTGSSALVRTTPRARSRTASRSC